MRPIISNETLEQAVAMIMSLASNDGDSLALAKRKAMIYFSIPYAQEGLFQKVPAYVEFSRIYRSRKSGEKRFRYA